MATVTLTWTDNSNNEDGFTIQRKDVHCAVPGTFVDIATVGPDVNTFTDTNSPFPYACYRVRATSASLGDSGFSNDSMKVLPQSGGHRAIRR